MADSYLGEYTAGEIPEPLTVTFTDREGAALNLTGFAASFVWERNDDTSATRTANVNGPTTGQATHTWVAADLAVPGAYRAQMWVGNGANRYASVIYAYDVLDGPGTPPTI